jgi:uncharacterized membrane protein
MKQSRLDSLADGIFAIVMTLLVFDIKIPILAANKLDNARLMEAIFDLYPLFLSYLLSFSLLFTYWRAHHFIASVFSKNIDTMMTTINAVFLFFVALVPFSAHLLGIYGKMQFSVVLFALHMIFIGLSLYAMRRYAEKSKTIKNEKISATENRHSYIRIFFPMYCALIAIIISFVSTNLALALFTLGIFFNFLPKSTRTIDNILGTK